MRARLLSWQWDGYPEFHRAKLNLWIHIVAVPMFIGSTASFVASLVTMQWVYAASALGSMVVAFAMQAIGHKREAAPPIPFEGAGDVVSRIFVEQFVTFPRFFFSGGWWRAMRGVSG